MADREPTPHRALGLTARLVLGYTLAASLMLSVAGVLLYQGLKHSFEIEDAENLSDHVKVLRREMAQRPQDLSVAREIIMESADERRVEKYYGRLMDETGRVLVETPGFSGLAPADGKFPLPVRLSDDVTEVKRSHSGTGAPTFLAAARVRRGKAQPALVYQVVMDAERVNRWLADYRLQFALVVMGGTLFAALVAWLITRRGLRPLRQITKAVQGVPFGGLNEHLVSSRWPGELAVLAGEFDKMLARLRDSFQRLAQFSADAAHEFRTPLNNLMVATSLTLSRERSAEEYHNALVANLDEYERLKRTLESLLFLARAENAETVLHKTALDAMALTADVLEFFSALAEERGVTLACEGNGRVFADETLLRLALTNLLSNALRHTPPEGRVTVTVRTGAGCEFAVRDTGPGIAPEHRPRVFDRFYRVDQSRANGAEGGAGLGLALVKTIMDLHHGTVELAAGDGGGSCFRLYFPPDTGA